MEKKKGGGDSSKETYAILNLLYNFSISIELSILNGKKETHTFFSLQVTLKEVGYIYFITAKLCAKVEYFKKAPCINCNFLFKNNHVICVVIWCNTILLNILSFGDFPP